MLQINYKNNWYELEFDGIKIIETNYTTNFIKAILKEEINEDEKIKLIIDGKKIKWKNVIYINELTKINDFLSLNKSNYLYKKILELVGEQSFIDGKLVNSIIDVINEELKIENLLVPQYDVNKIINACFELNDLGYLTDEIFFDLINKIEFDEKKLLIFDNVKFAKYDKIKKLLNNFNVLIVCTDLRDVISYYQELEICCLINNSIFEIISIEKLISYLEMKTSWQITQQDLNNYLSKNNDQKCSIINFHLKNL